MLTTTGAPIWTPSLPTLGKTARHDDVVAPADHHAPDTFHPAEDPESAAAFHAAHVRDRATHLMEGSHFLLDGLEMGGVLGSLGAVGPAGNAGLAIGLAVTGIGHVRHGLKFRDAESVLEGSGSLFLSAKSGLETFASLAEGLAPASAAAGAVESVIPVLGVTHGLLDAAAGAVAARDGVREKDRMRILDGLLGVGVGVSHTVAALGGGIPALVVAGTFLATKMVVHGMHDHGHHGAHHGHGQHEASH